MKAPEEKNGSNAQRGHETPKLNRLPGTPKTDTAHASHTTADSSPYAESLLEACAAQPRLQSFASAIATAGLGDLLQGDGPLTIFAPTNVAFEKIPEADLNALLSDGPRLADLLRHHVVAGRVKAPKAAKPRKVTPQSGYALELTASSSGFHVDEARIVKTNIRATNGVIHAIDTVLGVD